jgi:hypothetical protein
MGRRTQHPPSCETSVLDAVGAEIVAIVAPVSACMFCCVFLVRLHPSPHILRPEAEFRNP